jgi:hypothetical protein
MSENIAEVTGTEFELEEQQPFDPTKISIDTKPLTMEACLRRLIQGSIILAPDFQRNEVWNDTQKSRLIESLMLKIPIPMFYVSADENGNYTVVDGLQRLSTIRSFILGDKFLESKKIEDKGNGFKLQNLEFWNLTYADKNFNGLPIHIQNRLLETEFTFTIINPGTPEEVKRNVFKRLNTGGEPLTAQEIRHALYLGKSTQLLSDLAKSTSFIQATSSSIRDNRMEDRELILRFISFLIRHPYHYYKNNDMDSFLCDTMIIINHLPSLDSKVINKIIDNDLNRILIKHIEEIRSKFELAMERAFMLFGIHSFRKSLGNRRRTQVNKALFETWGVLLSSLSQEKFDSLLRDRVTFMADYEKHIDDIEFQNMFSRDSLKYGTVQKRFEVLQNLLIKYS